MRETREEKGFDARAVGRSRRAYRRPELREYGKVRELTAGPSGGAGDGASGMRMSSG